MPLNGSVHRPSQDEINPTRAGKIYGPTPQKAIDIVAEYTAGVPGVMIANPLAYLGAMIQQDVQKMKTEPVNGAELIAVSLLNIMQCWFDAYRDDNEMTVDARVTSYWDCMRGLAENPLWLAPMNLSGRVAPAMSGAMLNFDSSRAIELKRGNKGFAYAAEKQAYVLVLGAVVDGAAGAGLANLAMRDLKECFEAIT